MSSSKAAAGKLLETAGSRQKRIESFKLFLLVLPCLALVFVFHYMPLWGWVYAFFQYKPGMSLANCKFVGFQNFTNLFGNPVMRQNLFRVLRNTLGIQFINYLLMPVPMLFAIFLSEIKSTRFQKCVQTLTTLPHFISWVIMFSLMSSLFGSSGLVNALMQKFGAEMTVNILTTDKHVWLIQALLYTWKNLGWNAIIYFAAITGLDQEVNEAAMIDGANRWQRIRYITIPLLMPTFFVLLIMSIPLQKPEPQPTKNGDLSSYTINDTGVGDVDGDGQYEIIVKWYPDNAFDSGKAVAPSSPTIFDIYEMDGTPLWRLNMGLEMPSGAHFNQFMLYDMDEDGKAELFIKTSDGTVAYKPNKAGKFDMTDESTIVSYVGDKSVVPGTNINANGHASPDSNEYVTVFSGQTGEIIDSIDYINVTGNYDDWGKAGDGGNRSARYNIAIGYLPKEAGSTETIPAVFFNRGYYAKTTIAAYTLRNGKLQLEWNFVALTGEDAADKGNHNVSTGDLDQDGFDEICIGNMAVDHDGSLLWVKNGKDGQDLGSHGDAIHLAAMNPNNPTQLYVFSPTEEYKVATVNQALSNAGTGLRYDGIWTSAKDVGRAVAANITPLPGYEYWGQANNSGVYNILSGMVNPSRAGLPVNWVLYWDGDLLSELGDGVEKESCDFGVYKYNWESGAVDTIDVLDGKTNNSTKNNPSLTADILGDWREEVMLRNEDDTELRIYMTTAETDYMIYTLMHDPVYRNCVANQNSAYNQPPHIGFYLGEDNKEQVLSMNLPTANIVYTTESKEVGKPIGTLDYAGIFALKKEQALDTLKGFFS